MTKSLQRGAANRALHDPRAAALRIIDRVLSGTEASQAVLDMVIKESALVPSDKSLCTELVYGYLRNSLRLRWELERLLKNPEKLPEEMRLVLELAAYEIAFLRVPAHASVNWAVSRLKHRFGSGLAGVGNGVLRNFARSIADFSSPERYVTIADPTEQLAVRYSLPLWIVRLWLEAYPPEQAKTYMEASCSRALPAVRVNARREDAEKALQQLLVEGKGESVAAHGVFFREGVPYLAKTLQKKGRASYQSAAVQECLEECGMAEWSGPIWDACAGRGGKTAAMLERSRDVRLATDNSRQRIALLPEELKRLGLDEKITVLQADATALPTEAFDGDFATIVADVPCSGLGTLARRPEIRLRRDEGELLAFTRLQDAILDAAEKRLSGHGKIVYITCTLNPAENQDRVAAFLQRHEGFRLSQEFSTSDKAPWNEFLYAAVLQR